MKAKVLSLFAMSLFIAFGCSPEHTLKIPGNTSEAESKQILKTGWYFVHEIDSAKSNIGRELGKTTRYYKIDPKAIVTAENFEGIYIQEETESLNGLYSLYTYLDEEGESLWNEALTNDQEKSLALIINNQLIGKAYIKPDSKPEVPHTRPISFTEAECKQFKALIQDEKMAIAQGYFQKSGGLK
jgi:preprotein translocase subunit SecD